MDRLIHLWKPKTEFSETNGLKIDIHLQKISVQDNPNYNVFEIYEY